MLADFSSLGPTGDGRIKPEVVADGVNVLSSISTADNAYDIYSGTSMATPATAGSSFLLQEYYQKLHGGTFMHSSTLKGLLIHTTDEAGNCARAGLFIWLRAYQYETGGRRHHFG